MNLAFFEQLAPAEASVYLARFVELGRSALPDLVAAAESDGVRADLSVGSVGPVMDWVATQVATVPLEPDPTLPDWIRASDSYEANLFDFDEPSKVLVLRSGYYLGESFVRAFPRLTWAVGREETAPQGQPVVSGFSHEMEMPVLLVAENLIGRAIAEKTPRTDAARAVAVWESKVPD